MARIVESCKKCARLYRTEIWQAAYLNDRSWRGRLYAVLRVISITITVFVETKAASRAAALSFSSLLAFGPLVAITMVVAGMVLDQKDPDLAANTVNKLVKFIAPQVATYEDLTKQQDEERRKIRAAERAARAAAAANGEKVPEEKIGAPINSETAGRLIAPSPTLGGGSTASTPGTTASPAGTPNFSRNYGNPGLVQMINGFIAGSKSGAAGTVGALTLITIVLFLFKSIEDVFNEIWGVRRGRSWMMRVVFYWTVLTLGAVLFFGAVTLLGAGAFVNVFIEKLPYGKELLGAAQWMLPAFAGLLVIILLTLFYRYIPHTHVFWRAALIGAVVVAVLLLLNNFLAFLYVKRVVLSRSLYGSVGILPILMFGLYIFWLYVLIGGQISYAVQNVHFRNSQTAWNNMSENMRERLSLVVLIIICRRFQACQPAITASHLGDVIKVPTQIMNECLNRLVDMKLITPIPPPGNSSAVTDYFYQPSRPLNRINLLEFKQLDDNLGLNPVGEGINRLDPILPLYTAAIDRLGEQAFFKKTLEELIEETSGDVPKLHPISRAT